MFRRHRIGLWVIVPVLLIAGCDPSIPAKPPRPVNPLYQNGHAKEGTLEASVQSVQKAIGPLLEKSGWKAVATDMSSADGLIEAEAKKGERVEIRYESRGEKSTSLSIKGNSTTSQAIVDGLYDKIQKGPF